MPEKYKPSQEDIIKAEKMMTEEERESSNERMEEIKKRIEEQIEQLRAAEQYFKDKDIVSLASIGHVTMIGFFKRILKDIENIEKTTEKLQNDLKENQE